MQRVHQPTDFPGSQRPDVVAAAPAPEHATDEVNRPNHARVFQLVFRANLSDRPELDSTLMITGLVVYLVLNLGAVVTMLVRYGKTG